MKITRDTILELIQDIVTPAHDVVGNDIEYGVDEEQINSWIELLNKTDKITKVELVFEDENKKEYSVILNPKGESK